MILYFFLYFINNSLFLDIGVLLKSKWPFTVKLSGNEVIGVVIKNKSPFTVKLSGNEVIVVLFKSKWPFTVKLLVMK
jgi:hypothetical protein